MITREEADRLRDQLLAVLDEDAHNTERLLARLDAISHESGVGAHAALLLILTRLAFEDGEARRHWQRVLAHRETLAGSLSRDVGIRVALFDYFINVNRRMVHPTLIDIEMFESERTGNDDALTGLAGDRSFRSTVQAETRRAKRYGQHVSVALFDLDDFAAVNRELGDLVADRILRETAILLNNKIRDIDLAARPGEDELALVLPETDRGGALLVADRFRGEVAAHFGRREVGGRPVGLTVSAGVASCPEDADAPEMLLARAAQALYQAKASGKNTVSAFQPERRRFLRFELEPGRFEVEVLAPKEVGRARARNLSRNGFLFASPEALEVGEEIELRLLDGDASSTAPPRLRGRVVRLEQIPEPATDGEELPGAGVGAVDRFEVGVVFDLAGGRGEPNLAEFLERARSDRSP